MKRRVVLLYAIGPHFDRALRVLRARYAEAELVALVPSNLPIDEQLANSVNRIEVMRKLDASGFRGRIEYARAVRNVRCDTLAILYPSFAQKMVSALSQATEHLYIGPDGYVTVLTKSPASLAASEIARRFGGLLTYAKMHCAVRFKSVRPRIGRRDP